MTVNHEGSLMRFDKMNIHVIIGNYLLFSCSKDEIMSKCSNIIPLRSGYGIDDNNMSYGVIVLLLCKTVARQKMYNIDLE